VAKSRLNAPLNEEYFEWIDVLESVEAANNNFVMVELGAGYGRWLVRAVLALRQRDPAKCHSVAVEAEPKHFQWLRQHFRDSGVDPEEHTVVQAVVSDRPGTALFYVGMPSGGLDRADQWYGQAIAQSYEKVDCNQGFYEGFSTFRLKSGWTAIKVPSITLNSLLKCHDRVDLIDMDVQGEELKVVASSVEGLQRRVARLHIGTHGHGIEDGLRKVLGGMGWICSADYPCLSKADTPWGSVDFLDGVQSWVNPRFAAKV
jgi:FkbM family methyltransferase